MDFHIDNIDQLFPRELSEQRKGRLRDGLNQFYSRNTDSKLYTEFYSESEYPYFLQGDLIREIRFPSWDNNNHDFSKQYYDAIIISNTCDLDESNKRHVPKQVVIAKLITLEGFAEALRLKQVNNPELILQNLRNQEYSNLMYFPEVNGVEYIAALDEISSISQEEIISLKNDFYQNRIKSLDLFGYYLFMFKLSYHLCRLPEETDR